ncbi:MAG: hypothetical protein U0V75_08260 [Ferruginibacter sp.]
MLLNKCFLIACFMLLLAGKSSAQVVQYCRENVSLVSPDDLQLIPGIGGNYHLLSLTRNEYPELYIYNDRMALYKALELPFKFSDRSRVNIIPLKNYYYIYIYTINKREHQFWKVDAVGNCTDQSVAFRKLISAQSGNLKLGFQLIPYHDELWMVYHTAMDNMEKNTVVMVQTDSLLNTRFAHKVEYDFKRDEERLVQEALVFNRYLIVLKSQQSGSALEVMKVNLATGYTIRNTFRSSGYIYSQAGFNFNEDDTTITITSMLTEPIFSYKAKQYVFVSRLDRILKETTPLNILKTQFRKNTNANFLLVNGTSRWIRLKKRRYVSSSPVMQNNPVSVYQDMFNADASQNNASINSLLAKMDAENNTVSYSDEVGVRFSLLNTSLDITSDTLVKNTKDSYTVKDDQSARFELGGKEYLLVAQQFFRRKNGLLLVSADDNNQLRYDFLRVNEKNKYIVTKSKNIPGEGIVIPYVRKREVGFIKIALK